MSVFDHGFLYGDGIYETLRAYGGRIFQLAQHVGRLRRSAESIGLVLPIPEPEWPPLLAEALQRNDLTDAYLRITISRGEGEIGLDPALCPRPTVVLIAKPLPAYPAHLVTDGVGLALVSVRRNLPGALDPRIKSLNFLNNILAKREATRAGAFDALMLNAAGHLAECTTSNVFFVRGARLFTPSVATGILDGVTRGVVLQLAGEHGIPTEEGAYSAQDLQGADECFLTNTTLEVLPVASLDGRSIGSGRPGPVTLRLRELFRASIPRFLSSLQA